MKLSRALALSAVWLALAALGYFGASYLRSDGAHVVDTPELVNVNGIAIALPDLDGQPKTLSTWKGRPLLINVWGTWCTPCRREIPLLKALQNEYADRDLTVIGIAIDDMESAVEYAREDPFNYPILVGEEDGAAMTSALGVTSMVVPVTAFVDRAGNVRRLHLGEIHRDEAELALQEILAP